MKKFFLCFFCFNFLIGFLLVVEKANSQVVSDSGSYETKISARVGEFNLNLSGIASPFASIILKENDVVLKTNVADREGKFNFKNIPIKKSFSNFCLEALDFKRSGESKACIAINPAIEDVNMDNIFLPPTIGISKKQIIGDESATVSGFSIPGSKITINFNSNDEDGKKIKDIEVVADKDGKYSYVIKSLKTGKYFLVAGAYYDKRESLPSVKSVALEAVGSQGNAFSKDPAALIFLSFSFLIVIVVLILKLNPKLLKRV